MICATAASVTNGSWDQAVLEDKPNNHSPGLSRKQLTSLRHQTLGMLSPAWRFTFIGAAFAVARTLWPSHRPLSGDGSPCLPISSFDSILIRPRESMPHLIEPS
jgi:hypothetical protein